METVKPKNGNILKTPAETLKALSLEAGVSVGELARLAGYSERTLRRVQQGEVCMSERMLSNLERAVEHVRLMGPLPILEGSAREKLRAALHQSDITMAGLAKRIGYSIGVIE